MATSQGGSHDPPKHFSFSFKFLPLCSSPKEHMEYCSVLLAYPAVSIFLLKAPKPERSWSGGLWFSAEDCLDLRWASATQLSPSFLSAVEIMILIHPPHHGCWTDWLVNVQNCLEDEKSRLLLLLCCLREISCLLKGTTEWSLTFNFNVLHFTGGIFIYQ